ncbi:hypothetical protein MmiAt1_11920 [Methanimicrococcus sp. At1]|uniref:Uncharacterized protein n=1 Tax=Methanimicrococcus hacksteinii TaxID=3028293 RepID=A0ABU3VQC3_9EURY|nr:hypothetical protein [Methanimicrococcus sp. At1]MDV0445606.1 hypothetical protein [Methanimicrococcus sp. At1]
MTQQLPIKYRVLEILSDDKPHWNNDIVRQLQSEYTDLKGDYGRDSANFDMIELASNGLIKSVDVRVDEEGTYKKGALLHEYALTDFGRDRAEYAGVYKEGNK